MADLHTTLLHRINPDATAMHASWPYKAIMWPVHATDLATTYAKPRSPAALGIQTRHHPCSSPWIPMNASDMSSADLAGAATYFVGLLNDFAQAGRFGGPCRQVRLRSVSSGK